MGDFVKKLPVLIFGTSILLTVFAAGMFTAAKKLFPYPQIRYARDTIKDFKANWKSEFGILPTRHLIPRTRPGNGVVTNVRGKVAPGLVLLSGLFDDKVGLRLIDRDGKVIHSWLADYHRFFPDKSFILRGQDRPKGKWDYEIHGALVRPDGSVVINFEFTGLVKLDRCGKMLWTVKRQTHHSVVEAKDGTFWAPARAWHATTPKRLAPMKAPFYEDRILHISANGKIIGEISFPGMLLKDGLVALMASTGHRDPTKRSALDSEDPTHVNDVDVLTAAQAAKIPGAKAGDLMVSSRELNLVIIFDPKTLKVVWRQTGPWLRQHDPEILPDGRISVLNNNIPFNASNIMVADPVSGEVEIVYGADPKAGFYTNCCGRQKHLPDGNMLITSARQGRIFEVDPKGDIVWEFVHGYDSEHIAVLLDGLYYPKSYFHALNWQCTPTR